MAVSEPLSDDSGRVDPARLTRPGRRRTAVQVMDGHAGPPGPLTRTTGRVAPAPGRRHRGRWLAPGPASRAVTVTVARSESAGPAPGPGTDSPGLAKSQVELAAATAGHELASDSEQT